ncbi:hypothetical protein C8Q77DRAFT_1206944 [Trametes polyzona]|nr:hypothetical protein C8Q77DRAFT_1206944 [Trametes polyzona]
MDTPAAPMPSSSSQPPLQDDHGRAYTYMVDHLEDNGAIEHTPWDNPKDSPPCQGPAQFEAELSENYLALQPSGSTQDVIPTSGGSYPQPPASGGFYDETSFYHGGYTGLDLLSGWNALPFDPSVAPDFQFNGYQSLYMDHPAYHTPSTGTLSPLHIPHDPLSYPASFMESPTGPSTYSTIADALIPPSSNPPSDAVLLPSPSATSPAITLSPPTSGAEATASSHVPQTPRRRSSRRSNDRSKTSSPYPTPSPNPSPSGSSLELVPSSRRNAVVSSPAHVTSSQGAAPNKWKCPYCPYVQKKKRSPDLKRHIETHTRPAATEQARWVCCGVPISDARAQGVPEATLAGPPFEYEGLLFVGGCGKVFSRRDALSRHLRARAGWCFGDASALYLPGNRVAAEKPEETRGE